MTMYPGVNAACKLFKICGLVCSKDEGIAYYRLENLFHTRSPKYAGQSFGVDVDIKPDIEILCKKVSPTRSPTHSTPTLRQTQI